MPIGQPVNLGSYIISQGELAVGATTVRLTSTQTLCSRVWIGAPTANHTKGSANTGRILAGSSSTSNASGGMTLESANSAGFYVHVADASKLYFTGFNAGDVVEYQIWS